LPEALLAVLAGADGAPELAGGVADGALLAPTLELEAGAGAEVAGALLDDAAAALVVVDELAVGLLDPLLQPANAVITTATAMRGRRCL